MCMTCFVSRSKYLTIFILVAPLLVGEPLWARAPSDFPFESFSFGNDALFGQEPTAPRLRKEKSPSDPPSERAEAKQIDDLLVEPQKKPKQRVTQDDFFQIQIAVDKAISRILKLTLDYESLRNQVAGLSPISTEQPDAGFHIGESGEQKLKELFELNRKQLVARDNQLRVVQTRLDAVQERYDNENVSRLLLEKRLKIQKDKEKKVKAHSRGVNDKVNFLARQLEINQATIRGLKVDITKEQLNSKMLAAEHALELETKKSVVSALKSSSNTDSNEGIEQQALAAEWIIQGLKFAEGSTDIQVDTTVNLDKLASHLVQNKDLNVQVNGYTDSIGSAASNEVLSQQRAEAVSEYLQENDVEFYRIKALGYGERRPIASNDTEQGREKNRRVAILFLN